jgi:hypothetical protein
MSFCGDLQEIEEAIQECKDGEMTREELVFLVLGHMNYQCDAPSRHDCYRERCLIWAKKLSDALKEIK